MGQWRARLYRNKPLIKPEDFRGLKMRIQGSKVLDAAVRELGAIPQIMGFGELYQALQTGVVDGEDNVPSNILTQKFYEVQKYLTVSYHGRLTYALVTNKKFWDGLPADLRSAVARAMKESTDYFNETAAKDNADALEKIKATGKIQVHVLTDEEKKVWVAKLMPVHKRDAEPFRQGLHRENLQSFRLYADVLTGVDIGRGARFEPERGEPNRGRHARSHPRPAGRMDHRGADRRRDLPDLRRRACTVTAPAIPWCSAPGRRPMASSGSACVCDAVYDLLTVDQSVLGPGTRHLYVRVDGEVRRRSRGAYRHPCRRRCLRQAASPPRRGYR